MKYLLSCFAIAACLSLTAQTGEEQQSETATASQPTIEVSRSLILSNGLKVIVIEDRELPKITYTLTLDNPLIPEDDQPGITALVHKMTGNGSENISKEEFENQIKQMGASFSFGLDKNVATGLSGNHDQILNLFSDALLHPNFTTEELEKIKAELITKIEEDQNHIEHTASDVANILAYGKSHPRSMRASAASLKSISLEDVQKFYHNYFVPANAYLTITGDISFEEGARIAEKNFSEWAKATPPSFTFNAPKDPYYTQIAFIDMPGASKSRIIYENLIDLKMNQSDYPAVILANSILGRKGKGRLFRYLTETKGFTNNVTSHVGYSKKSMSTFQVRSTANPEDTENIIKAILEVLENMKETPVTDTELQQAQQSLIADMKKRRSNPVNRADQEVKIMTESLPSNFYADFEARILSVSLEDIQRAANTYFKSDRARIIVVGDGSDMLSALKSLKYKNKPVPVKFYDRNGEPATEPKYTSEIPEGTDANTILQKFIDSLGGRERLEEISSMYMSAEGKVQGMSMNMEIKKLSGKYSMAMKMMGSTITKQVYNGESGYMIVQGNVEPMPEKMINELNITSNVFPELAMLNNNILKLDRVEMLDGRKTYVLSGFGNKYMYFDAKSGLKIKEETVVKSGNETIVSTTLMGDYREVNGIKFPYFLSQTTDNQEIEMNVQTLKLNEGVSDTDFQ
ncbi:insulinase family protein [Robertkochia solimangrovi]|uniref:insulinase family protein n=1 Tax=Robertkochia solimangrovi TaxID=2213046 RepID=UPI0013A554BE|nr:insulinase family protein [Robertkochia solimangrovi]